jgi:hypothetical protein
MTTIQFDRGASTVSLPVPEGMQAGDPVRIGAINGVLVTDRAPDSQHPAFTPVFGGGNRPGHATVKIPAGVVVQVDVDGEIASADEPVYLLPDGSLTAAATRTDGEATLNNPLWGYALSAKGAGVAPIAALLAGAGA